MRAYRAPFWDAMRARGPTLKNAVGRTHTALSLLYVASCVERRALHRALYIVRRAAPRLTS
jgi:hypothetical protein